MVRPDQPRLMPARAPAVVARTVPGTGEVVLLVPGTATAVVLDTATHDVLLCCDGTSSRAEVAERTGLDLVALDEVLVRLVAAGLVGGSAGLSRRAALAGGALLGAAGIVATALPAAAAAASGPVEPPLATSNAYAWGRGANGQLGTGGTTAQPTPVQVALPAGVTLTGVAAGAYQSYGLGSDGHSYAWGNNGFGVLGVGDNAQRTLPTQVVLPAGVRLTSIDSSAVSCVATGSDGRTYAWGNNSLGAVGVGESDMAYYAPTPVPLPAGVTLSRVAAGENFCLGVGGGRAYAWGDDSVGQLGVGSSRDRRPTPVPIAVPAGVTFTDVAAGIGHSLAMGDDGRTYAWGGNVYGQLGTGDTANQLVPVPVRTPAGVTFVSIAAGGQHCLAVGSDGKTYAWGRNDQGQLGDGTTTSRSLPVAVALPALVTLSGLAGGRFQSLGIGSDGNTYAWGDNAEGQLGDGTTLDRSRPLPVLQPVGVQFTALGAGFLHSLGIQA